ncbi:MAG: hypothetical protein LBS05_03020 [Tannerellaceae bacterium]|nr:hypothetical protein [Tannerellaceae bacterium]
METNENILHVKNATKRAIVYDKKGTPHEEYKRWGNGRIGYFDDPDNNCLYRFIELVEKDGRLGDPIYSEYDKENKYWYSAEGRDCYYKQKARQLPALAGGFVGWLIKHWGDGTQTIFSGYLQARLAQYKAEHKNDADVFKRDLEREFYDQYRAKEEQWVRQSEGIFSFISDPEVNQIKGHVRYYFEYVSQFETKTNPSPQPEAAKKLESNTNAANTGEPQQYTLDMTKISAVYKFCIDTGVLDNAIVSDVKFINAVHEANFREIHAHAASRGMKTKCTYIISVLSKFIPENSRKEWYLKTAHSIGTEPTKCSGANVPSGWRREVDRLK